MSSGWRLTRPLGVKVGPLSMVDGFGTPQSDAFHVVERYAWSISTPR